MLPPTSCASSATSFHGIWRDDDLLRHLFTESGPHYSELRAVFCRLITNKAKATVTEPLRIGGTTGSSRSSRDDGIVTQGAASLTRAPSSPMQPSPAEASDAWKFGRLCPASAPPAPRLATFAPRPPPLRRLPLHSAPPQLPPPVCVQTLRTGQLSSV